MSGQQLIVLLVLILSPVIALFVSEVTRGWVPTVAAILVWLGAVFFIVGYFM